MIYAHFSFKTSLHDPWHSVPKYHSFFQATLTSNDQSGVLEFRKYKGWNQIVIDSLTKNVLRIGESPYD